MLQEHNRLIKKHKAIAISIMGYLGLIIIFVLIFLSIFMQGIIQIISTLSLVLLFILLFIFRNPKKLKFFNFEIE